MGARLKYLRYLVGASFWFVPACLMLAAFLLSLLTVYLDIVFADPFELTIPGALDVGPAAARELLSTVASSMITVASLVFSMTLVVLTLASQQLGPRIVTLFMQDRINQAALGTFVATFLYALLILQSVTEGDGAERFVPHISLLVALVLAIVNIGWLVYFIHHIANTIQADFVIAGVNDQLSRAVERRFPRVAGNRGHAEAGGVLDTLSTSPALIHARQSGYVQTVDVEALLEAAHRHDLVIRLAHRPGDFVFEDVPIMEVWPDEAPFDDVESALRGALLLGRKRTPVEDIEYAISQLVDIALRAMSPGINDPQTAITCVDHLGEGLARLIKEEAPLALVADDEGALRLIVRPVGFEEALGAAFDQIRQFAQTYFRVLMRVLEILEMLARFARTEEQRHALAIQAGIYERTCQDVMREEVDLHGAETRLAAFRAALDDSAESSASRSATAPAA